VTTPSLHGLKEAYDEHYVLDNKLMLEWYPHRVLAMATGSSLLELGLGHGYSTEVFAQHFSRYKVIEGSREMIERFRRRFNLPQIEIVQGFFEEFETEERFENIGMGFILEHVDDPGGVLRRFRRFLKPGGSVFIAVPNSESLHRRFGHEAGLLPDLQSLSQADHDYGHQRYFCLATLSKLVEQADYNVVKAEGLFLKPITTQQITKLGLSSEILQAMLKVGIEYPELCNAILMQARPRL
jgi:ubiquinone/menaquinone biosynthesis C-methylase UbiE